ncbi:FolC bifunctional protein [Xylariaceae sp. FL0594]|nr:FolC bifunctional protein [Xylariaceae sp. FL0594]
MASFIRRSSIGKKSPLRLRSPSFGIGQQRPLVTSKCKSSISYLNTNSGKVCPFSSSSSSTMGRTYESALADLAALQSNRAITSLFSPPAPPPPSSSSKIAGKEKGDLNALAIPEMLAWLARAGVSQDVIQKSRMRCIHVAGTKGKGSVCAYLTALLLHSNKNKNRQEEGVVAAAGKVGTYTSPHLVSVRERIAIDGVPISPDLFARYFYEVWDACTEAARAELELVKNNKKEEKGEKGGKEISEEELRGPATKPFFFRFLTLVALRAFLGEGVRSAVIECGIGGEFDSTNVLPPSSVSASVITQLGIDHVGMLGATLPEIAWHKAGVCKDGRKCFTRRLAAAAEGETTMQVLRRRAAEKGAVLVEVDDDEVERWGGVFVVGKSDEEEGGEGSGTGTLEGEFQKYNQALAVYAAREHLRVLGRETVESPQTRPGNDEKVDERLEDVPLAFTSALQDARLRGRCETRKDRDVGVGVTWWIDGAHTAESLKEVARWYVGKIRQKESSSLPLPTHTQTQTQTQDQDAEEKEKRKGKGAAARILLFNQQDRDAAGLVTGLLRDIETHTSHTSHQNEDEGDPPIPISLFTHAIFTRNDLLPRDPGTTEPEPERDLSAQRSAADALRSISPGTEIAITDNVSDAVDKVRSLSLAMAREGKGKGEEATTVLVTGSLHLVGALLRTLEPDAAV